MCVYNGADFIISQIDSILNQKGIKFSLVIIDDNSVDSTLMIVRNKYRHLINIGTILIHKNEVNLGIFKNFINGLKFVLENYDFEYLAFSDQDDIWLENKLKIGVETLELNFSDAYSSSITIQTCNGQLIYRDKISLQKKYDYLYESAGPGSTFILRRKLVSTFIKSIENIEIGLRLHYDWLIYAYARSNNYKWIIDNNSYIKYIQHDKNAIGANFGFIQKYKRLKSLVNGEFYSNANKIHKLIYHEEFKIIFKLKNLYQFRRSVLHSILITIFSIIHKNK